MNTPYDLLETSTQIGNITDNAETKLQTEFIDKKTVVNIKLGPLVISLLLFLVY